METDEEWCIVGEELAAIVWRRVHKLFTSDCVPTYTTYRMSKREISQHKIGVAKSMLPVLASYRERHTAQFLVLYAARRFTTGFKEIRL